MSQSVLDKYVRVRELEDRLHNVSLEDRLHNVSIVEVFDGDRWTIIHTSCDYASASRAASDVRLAMSAYYAEREKI